MAKNLHANLSPTDSVTLFDINQLSSEQIASEMKSSQVSRASVELASSAFDACKTAVRRLQSFSV